MTLEKTLQMYHHALESRGITPDPVQTAALATLASIHEKLVNTHHLLTGHRIKHHLNKVFGLKQHPINGVYFWGDVGRGKTLLMDIFFEHLPFKAKQRMHFHPFMRKLHEDLKTIQGIKNPLRTLANELAKHTHVLCFDEFHVDDVADALLLAEFIKYLYHEGITVLFTSNTPPDDLYRHGVQRQLFMPVIHLIKEHSHLIHFSQDKDYRLSILMSSGLYFSPLNIKTQEAIKHKFNQLATGTITYGHTVTIQERNIPTVAIANNIIWFDFKDLCQSARSAHDYMELVERYDLFILTHVPQMSAHLDDSARRFVHWIDVLYDHKATLILSAQVPIISLYTGQDLRKEFQRTTSRLIEMQTDQYLA